jgi:AraC-like DNA-binding protein
MNRWPAPVRTSSVDRARRFLSEHFYSTFLEPLDARRPLAADLGVLQLDGVTVGDLRFGADVAVRLGELGAYHVDVALSGALAWRQGRGTVRIADPGRAAVFQPIGDTVLERWRGGCRLLAVKIDRPELELHLERLLGTPVRGPLTLGPELDTDRGPGRSWARLVALVADELSDAGGLVHRPPMAERLRETIVTGMLLAADHRYRDELDRPGARASPRTVKRAVDAIRARPEYPFTAAQLAGLSGVSVRALQTAFRRHVGMPPMAYLRHVRLDRAHAWLTAADPARATVTDVAYGCGFAHLGRFAAAYRAKYGTSPSHTLRGAG